MNTSPADRAPAAASDRPKAAALVAALLAGGLLVAGVFWVGARFNREEVAESGPRSLAAEFEKQGDYLRAAQTLRAAWRANPSDALKLETARAFVVAGDNLEAITLLSDPIEDRGLDYSRRHLLAEASVRARRYQDARTTAQELIEAAPADGRARLILARIAYNEGDFRGAESLLGEAVRAGGEALGEAWLFRARIALNANDLVAARSAAARAAHAGAPDYLLAAVEIEALAREARYQDAQKANEPLLRSEDAGAGLAGRRLAAFVDAASGRFQDAARRMRDLELVIEAEPYGDLFMSRTSTLAGDPAQGENLMMRSVGAAPKNPLLLAALVDDHIENSRLDAAESAVRRLRDVDVARAVMAGMRLARTRKDFDRLAEIARTEDAFKVPPFVDSMLFGAKSVAAANRLLAATADAALLKAAASTGADAAGSLVDAANDLHTDQADAAAFILAGELYLAANDDERAASAFERAMAAAPASNAALVGRARVDIRAGDLLSAERRLAGQASARATIVRARAVARQSRIGEAGELLTPHLIAVADDERDCAFAAEVFAAADMKEALYSLSELVRRLRPDGPGTPDLLARAGRMEEAISAARAGLVAAPGDEMRVDRYARLMATAGRQKAGAAFLKELSGDAARADHLLKAIRFLETGASEPQVAEAASSAPMRDIRRAYFVDWANFETTTAYAVALEREGEGEAARKLRREACFWGASRACG